MNIAPVLFIVFNRPIETARVFDAIRKVRPSKLYVAADGPRKDRNGDMERCLKVRSIVSNIDWPCEVRTLFREVNLGCRYGPSGAIDWFFEHEPEGIILEDDCLPHPNFFHYCTILLSLYRGTIDVMSISGSCFVNKVSLYNDFSFTYYADMWGWATWRRAWKMYDRSMVTWGPETQKFLERQVPEHEYQYWTTIFNAVKQGEIGDCWDYQWIWSVIANNGLVVTPHQNMIQNLGFGADATHTFDANWHLKNRSLKGIGLPIRKNVQVCRNRNLETEIGIARFSLAREGIKRKVSAAWIDLTTYNGSMFVQAKIRAVCRKLRYIFGC